VSELRQSVDDYLQVRRSLGYKLTIYGRVLPQFVEFLEQRDAPVITTSLALEFATQPQNASVVWWHQRLAIVRGFALHRRAFDPRTEVPPADLLPAKFGRAIPYLYSEAEIEALMAAARRIRSALKAATYETLIGLLAVSGMPVGEAIGECRRNRVRLAERIGHVFISYF
jgi:integrase/recombinase XerD